MKLLLFFCFLFVMSGCATTRVLVKECKEAGPGLQNCELVKEL